MPCRAPSCCEEMKPRRHLAARHPTTTALIVIDMINTWQMPHGPRVRRAALTMLPTLARLITRARRARVPVIYANDNFGLWRSNLPELIERCRKSHRDSAAIVEAIAPLATDYVVLKPKHSAFYATPARTVARGSASRASRIDRSFRRSMCARDRRRCIAARLRRDGSARQHGLRHARANRRHASAFPAGHGPRDAGRATRALAIVA